MEYRKEQTFIVAYDVNNNPRGKWNIISNSYIGVRGNPIKSIPEAFKVNDNVDIPTYIENALLLIKHYCNAYNPYNEARSNRIEQLISLQLSVDTQWDTWDFIERDSTKLTKEIVQYLLNNHNGIYNENHVEEYKFYKKHQDFFNKCGNQAKWAYEVLNRLNKDVPLDFAKDMTIRAIHEKVYATHQMYEFANILNRWYKMIDTLGDKLEVKHNILTNYSILTFVYNEYRNNHYDEILKHNNDLAWLYYENDNYTIYPLITRKDFHEEAEAQRNCVERMYMERVYDNLTHVVVVRKKIDPTKSYITCEVDKTGHIRQYLYRCNNRVTDYTDIELKNQYELHLQTSLSK